MDLLLQMLQQFLVERSIECYLVGGSLRDLLLGQRPQDLDLAVRGDPEPLARALAAELKGRFIALSLEKGVKRILLPKKPYGRTIIDIAPLHGKDILDDLTQRDFTINALALPMENAAALAIISTQRKQQDLPPLIDPCNGWHDLRARTLRVVQEHVFQKDPLRLLRAIRLSASRQLSIDPATARIIERDAHLLSQVAPERIRDELLHMLALPHVTAAIRALDEYRLFSSIFPTFYHSDNPVPSLPLEVRSRTWPTLTSMAKFLSASQGEAARLAQWERQLLAPLLQLSQRSTFKKRWKKTPARTGARSALLLLAALIFDLLRAEQAAAPPQEGATAEQWTTEELKTITTALKRLTLGRPATAFIAFLLQESTSPCQIEPRPQAKSGALWITARYYFERFGERGIDLAAFCLACQMAALRGTLPNDVWQAQAQTLLNLIEAYYEERQALIPPALLDGQTIIDHFGFVKGPLIGAILSKVRNAQLGGLIRTRADAIQFVTGQTATSSKGISSRNVSQDVTQEESAISYFIRSLTKPGE